MWGCGEWERIAQPMRRKGKEAEFNSLPMGRGVGLQVAELLNSSHGTWEFCSWGELTGRAQLL